MSFEKSKQLHERSTRSLAGGVSSNIRLGERPTPLFLQCGKGAHLIDADGNDYVDYMLGQGPDIFGHSPSFVIEAVTRAMEQGITHAGQHEKSQKGSSLPLTLNLKNVSATICHDRSDRSEENTLVPGIM